MDPSLSRMPELTPDVPPPDVIDLTLTREVAQDPDRLCAFPVSGVFRNDFLRANKQERHGKCFTIANRNFSLRKV